MTSPTVSSSKLKKEPHDVVAATVDGPIIITTRGRQTHVLMTFEHYRRIGGEVDATNPPAPGPIEETKS